MEGRGRCIGSLDYSIFRIFRFYSISGTAECPLKRPVSKRLLKKTVSASHAPGFTRPGRRLIAQPFRVAGCSAATLSV